ncbi:MAG TPA: hypothetical protein VF713_04145, partial [Thermoanaerobaculia bacterium]
MNDSKMRQVVMPLLFACGMLVSSRQSLAQYVQQGPKLVGTAAMAAARQGYSVALSADGNTAVVGGDIIDNYRGAAWIWTRDRGLWARSAKLSETGDRAVFQGIAVAISGDGLTVAVGGGYGASIWSANNGLWSQQASGLTGTYSYQQTMSVALSADGNTVIVGRPLEGGTFDGIGVNAGAALVWTRSGGVWTQQGPGLTGTGAIWNSEQGFSVSLSADGNTAIVGGPFDDPVPSDIASQQAASQGAAWIWTRSGGVWAQQGPKLVGKVATSEGFQGYSVALSADGNTAIIGGPGTVPGAASGGAICIWTRKGGVWTQQGPSLVASNGIYQGTSVSLSGDGNLAIVGSPSDPVAAWVWSRTNDVWSLQASKLVGMDASPPYYGSQSSQGYPIPGARQGKSVALSADGNTAIIGGPSDDFSGYGDTADHGYSSAGTGAAWIWTRSGSNWAQQGPKLTAPSPGKASQGGAVAISGDGNTAVVGGSSDHGGFGATWVWTRSGGTWTESAKLVGTAADGYSSSQGGALAISRDGNTVIVGASGDKGGTGAVWIFTRSGETWTQQGPKLVGSGAVTAANQGGTVALSADGNTALVGGYLDDSFYGVCCFPPSSVGAAWVWTRSGGVWSQQGPKLVGTGGDFSSSIGVGQGYSVALSADGNTALVGAVGDHAAWVWIRNGGVWTQQGSKLIGDGRSVALSGDGNTALLSASVWIRSSGAWKAHGQMGTNSGSRVSISRDGNTAILANPYEDKDVGAIYV